VATVNGKLSDVYVTAGAAVSMPTEPMSDISASGFAVRTTYAVTNAVKRYFDPATPLVIQQSLDSGGTWNAVTPDLIAAGFVQFVTPRQAAPLAQIRVLSGKYLPYVKIIGGKEWDLTNDMAMVDSTVFGQNSHNFVAVALSDGTASVKRFWQDDSLRSLMGNLMVLVLYIDATTQPAGPRYEMLALLKGDAIKQQVASLEEEDLTFAINGYSAFLAA
jgi:hypothetical protein